MSSKVLMKKISEYNAKSYIFTSATISPIKEFAKDLGVKNEVTIESEHFIKDINNHLLVGILG